ncbi:MAG: hypothetical protein US53_C0026G0003 [Candidatus Woesebacteria bacterium GW2011_GWA1_37_7]|uniref:Uncharacterized protein n=1 Tax=Candidatus Woesebacteria bacterium GW2011_GWA1_37_7 TaxID=1618545 RepID=A0A0G0HF62_9BACT|nr:MAG: hypothetical protein US53_C0026G0003 [Candidatus Woesebacteria bacterium GW2011_GWA1_37_7]
MLLKSIRKIIKKFYLISLFLQSADLVSSFDNER